LPDPKRAAMRLNIIHFNRGGSVKTCFISMPFGIKSDLSGRQIDFDRLYVEVLKPGVEGRGLTCLRGLTLLFAGL
jgi:hypothetical protein